MRVHYNHRTGFIAKHDSIGELSDLIRGLIMLQPLVADDDA